ncbi:MAG TPA: 50S ribosomal protein L23 [Methanocorpusculum sp.]|nr:50S ribosomal protein L23 [Methanocorpusculum sp.]
MILKYPIVTEKASSLADNSKQLSFIVQNNANKKLIKMAIESSFNKKVVSVNTMMTNHGTKKAIITFEDENAADEILSQLGTV